MLLNIHIIFNYPQSVSQCFQAMLREARLTLIGGVHVIILFVEGPISLEDFVALNFFPKMNEVKDKLVRFLSHFLVPIYTTGMISLIGLVTLLHNENNHVGML